MFYNHHNIKEDLRSPRKIPPASRFRFSLIFTMSLLTCFLGFTWQQTKYDINCGLASNNGNEHPLSERWQSYWFLAFALRCISFVDTLGCTKYVDWHDVYDYFVYNLIHPILTRKEDVCGRKNIALLRIVSRLCSADINLDKKIPSVA